MQNKTAFVIMVTLGTAMFAATLAMSLTVQSAAASVFICSPKNPHVCASSSFGAAETGTSEADTSSDTTVCPSGGPAVILHNQHTCSP
jgi:hypothetical protein